MYESGMATDFPVRCCGSAGEAFAAVLILSNAILFGVQAGHFCFMKQACRCRFAKLLPRQADHAVQQPSHEVPEFFRIAALLQGTRKLGVMGQIRRARQPCPNFKPLLSSGGVRSSCVHGSAGFSNNFACKIARKGALSPSHFAS